MTDRSRWMAPRGLLLLLLAVALTAGMAACGRGDRGAAAKGEEQAEGGEEHAEEEGVVRLDSAALGLAGIQVRAVETVESAGLPVTGTITYDANRVSHIGARTDGRIVALRADLGQRVRGGQVLAILESPEVGQIRAEEHEAASLVRIARENYERERRLEEQGISSRKELLDAEAELRRNEAAQRSARERLRVLGAGNGEGSRFSLLAPFAGVIVERHASLGEMAAPADRLFTLVNLERVWIELDIFERDLQRVAKGQRVNVATAAYPGTSFPGRIVHIGEILDPQKRTVRARVEIPNASGALKPGMFADAVIQVAGGGGVRTVVVPQEAVQEVEGRKVVFVPGDAAGAFRARPVELGEPVDGNRVTVLSGLQAGDRVVTVGAFALRSELAKGEFGGHGH